MKKYIFLMLIILSLISCGRKINDFYQGRVIDENNNPLEDVIVAEDNLDKQVKTDKTGYFKLHRRPHWLGNLIFIKEGYKTDTIHSVWHQHGETIGIAF